MKAFSVLRAQFLYTQNHLRVLQKLRSDKVSATIHNYSPFEFSFSHTQKQHETRAPDHTRKTIKPTLQSYTSQLEEISLTIPFSGNKPLTQTRCTWCYNIFKLYSISHLRIALYLKIITKYDKQQFKLPRTVLKNFQLPDLPHRILNNKHKVTVKQAKRWNGISKSWSALKQKAYPSLLHGSN